jgi:hypothetical protein
MHPACRPDESFPDFMDPSVGIKKLFCPRAKELFCFRLLPSTFKIGRKAAKKGTKTAFQK